MGSLHLFPVEKFLLLLLRLLRVEGIYSQKLKVCFGACLDSTVGAAGEDRTGVPVVSVTTCPYIPSSFIAGTTAKSHWQNPWLGSKPVLAAAACLGPRVRAEGDLPDLPAESHTGSPSGIFHSVSPTITPVGKCPGSKSKWLMFTFLPSLGNFPSWVAQGSCRPGK